MAEEHDRRPIDPPASNPGRDVARAMAEGVAELVPGAGVVTALLRVTHPPKSEQERDEWQKAITNRSNEHDQEIDRHAALLEPTETVTGLTEQLIRQLAQQCPDGLGCWYFELGDLQALLPAETAQAIEDAASDLEAYGLIRMRHTFSGWCATLTQAFYEQVDHQVMGWNTVADAAAIARLMMSEGNGDAAELHGKTGWTKRRFNPALAYVLQFFPEGRISRERQADYATRWVAIMPEDRAALRRFVARFEQSQRA